MLEPEESSLLVPYIYKLLGGNEYSGKALIEKEARIDSQSILENILAQVSRQLISEEREIKEDALRHFEEELEMQPFTTEEDENLEV